MIATLAHDLRVIFRRLEGDGRAAEAVVIRDVLHFVEACGPEVIEVIAERVRQVDVEGWSAAHDDRHDHGEMAIAAACYALASLKACRAQSWFEKAQDVINAIWPWAPTWWKPKDPKRDLVRAAALLIAEIARVNRAGAKA